MSRPPSSAPGTAKELPPLNDNEAWDSYMKMHMEAARRTMQDARENGKLDEHGNAAGAASSPKRCAAVAQQKEETKTVLLPPKERERVRQGIFKDTRGSWRDHRGHFVSKAILQAVGILPCD
uniref:Uncharacterized protein n=1 Tax=Neobodo designis TaxID=312471 RepID=A0A7S1LND3_NEODS|mmetsp:Transcript_25145/g.77681  ORF Transcript_25145/g.77681 Transcript_25145/m.77681 type:complete len:122 (+) Transcript_25145:95-460(+)